MPGHLTLALAAALIAILLLISALVVWQHAKRITASPTYGTEDAVEFVQKHLDPSTKSRLGEAGIRRILEFEVFYMQGLAQENRRNPVETVAGPHRPAIDYIFDQIESQLGRSYSLDDIASVLEIEVRYLESIGAIGDEIGGIPQ